MFYSKCVFSCATVGPYIQLRRPIAAKFLHRGL